MLIQHMNVFPPKLLKMTTCFLQPPPPLPCDVYTCMYMNKPQFMQQAKKMTLLIKSHAVDPGMRGQLACMPVAPSIEHRLSTSIIFGYPVFDIRGITARIC